MMKDKVKVKVKVKVMLLRVEPYSLLHFRGLLIESLKERITL